jgi:hypothetical protein
MKKLITICIKKNEKNRRIRMWKAFCRIVVLAFLSAGYAAQATTFDVAADFSATNNPNGVWSYGWSSTLTSAFNLYPNNGKVDEIINIDIWADFGHFSSYYPTPQVAHNGTGSINNDHWTITWQAGQFSLHPGDGGEYSHARWTAPDAGTIDIASMFTGIDHYFGTTTDVHVLHNGISLFDGLVNGFGNTSSFSTTVTVGKGDIIDFAVGYGINQSHTCDTTALSATISFIPEPSGMVWVSINDPEVSGHEGFTGYMSKYETTNAQYCQFLNAALASGDITVSGNNVLGASGSNSGADFVGQVYYDLAGPGYTNDGATNGGAARINYSGGVFSVDSGFENHPVTYVSWYGATAFCNYYGYRLPTEWEWQAVADYDGSYDYGCGTTINHIIANYGYGGGSTHPDGTTIVGTFGTYGYGMCDMAGNVWEFTSSIYSGSDLVIRGGGWGSHDYGCSVSYRQDGGSGDPHSYFGFRVASVPGVVEFTDEVTFKNTAGNPQYFIDFETYGDGTPVVGQPIINGNEWLNLEIQFAAVESGADLVLFEPPTKPEYVSPTHTLMPSGDRSSYIITFSTPVVSFGMYIVDSEITSTNEKIILKDSNGNILGDFPMPVNPNGTDPPISKEFRGYVSDIPIAEVLIIEDADGEGLSLDNVMYTTCPKPEWSFVQISDTHIGYLENGKDMARFRLAAAIKNILKEMPLPKFILVTGDIADYGCPDQATTSPSVYKDFVLAVDKALKKNIEVITVPGNHDWMGCPDSGPWGYVNGLAGVSGLTPAVELVDWEEGDLHFIGFDTGRGSISQTTGRGFTDPQWQAFQDIANNSTKSQVIFMHHPPFDDRTCDWFFGGHKQDFLDFCDPTSGNSVELVLSGHTHQNRIFNIDGDEISIQSSTYPKLIQTPSSGKQWLAGNIPPPCLEEDDDIPGYRVINVNGSQLNPQEYVKITDYVKNYIKGENNSPTNLHAYDSSGNHVGLVAGDQVECGINHSYYFYHHFISTEDGNQVLPEEIIIFDPCDDYLWEVVGKEEGTYRLVLTSNKDGNETVFEANGIPTLPGAVHDYLIDWDLLAQGGNGVTVLIDADDDGTFERTITSDSELTPEEFNIDPIADAGVDQTVFVGTDCLVQVSLDGSDSNDPDGGELSYTWSLGGQEIATGVNPTVELPLGVHTIELVVNDGIEDSEPDYVVITVLDNTLPELTVLVTPDVLWPPNHKMVQITSTRVVSDNCDDSPTVALVSIMMNEGDETNSFDPTFDYTIGDGHTISDIQIINGNIYLRAERSGAGTGRVYTLTYQAVDDSGNVAIRIATVTVPHNQP